MSFQNETIIETKTCRHCQASFPIMDKDLEFYDKISPIFGGKKYSIPTPTLCPDCRQQRRLSFRNERKLYKRNCDATGKSIISIYSPDKPFKVYHQDFWTSDKWDAMEYGRDFDFSKGFFEQVKGSFNDIPLKALVSEYNENCEYTSICGYCKDCYLTSASEYSENCYYGHLLQNSKYINDSCFIYSSEIIYEGVDCKKCFNSKYIMNCHDCSDIFGGINLIGCHDCVLCSNLRNKAYCINNIQYTKEEYLQKKRQVEQAMGKSAIVALFTGAIHKSMAGEGNENVTGSYINDSRDVRGSYEVDNGNNVRNSQIIVEGVDIYDCSNIYIKNQLSYEIMSALSSNLNIFSGFVFNCSHVLYSLNLTDSHNCFACIGLRNKSYCILNKQYTKEEYEIFVPKIIEHMMKTGEWGEFFPSSLSPFGYNETVAQEYFLLSKEEATKDGIFNWSDYEAPFPKVEKIIPASKLPDDITKIPDDILNWAIECEVTKKPFRIIKQELEFYRKHNLPIPRRHPDQRHLDRMALRNPRKLFERKCDKCGKEIITTYAPERPERVYCEECYNREVVG